MQLHVRHRTAFRYAEPVKYTAQALRLTPRRETRQRTLSWVIHAPGRRTEQVDAHGNLTHLLVLEDPHRDIEIVVTGIVEVDAAADQLPHDGSLSPLAYIAPTPLTQPDAALRDVARACLEGGGSTRDRLYRLAEGVRHRVHYRKGSTNVEDSAGVALARGEGVCQDHAHVFIACCRAAGIPARYVSGYLYTGDGGDAASHAWVDAWAEDVKAWVGIDVTHVEAAGDRHCRLAVGRDYRDAAPVRGVRRGGGHELMSVEVSVTKATQQQ